MDVTLTVTPKLNAPPMSTSTKWLVNACLGNESSKQLALQEAKSYLKLIPWAAVAAPINTSVRPSPLEGFTLASLWLCSKLIILT